MPHIQLEHTKNINTVISSTLFDELINILVHATSVNAENCKIRAIQLKSFHTGSKDKNEGFVHLIINILQGRTKKTKNKIGRDSLLFLQNYFKEYSSIIQISVEIREMNQENYFTSNTL